MTDIANLTIRVKVVTDRDIEKEIERRVESRLAEMRGEDVAHLGPKMGSGAEALPK